MFKTSEAAAIRRGAMETETIQKNGASARCLKKAAFVLFLLCCGNLLHAQDIITLRSGEEVKAVVQEVGLTDVKYKKYENKNGPTYSLPKSDIFMIKYENGTKDVFTAETARPKAPQAAAARAIPLSCKSGDVFIGDRMLGSQEVRNILSSNPQALNQYNSGEAKMIAGGILLGAGIPVMTVGLIGRLATTDKEATYLALSVCGGLVGCFGLLFVAAGTTNTENAVNLYNSSITRGKTSAYNLKFGVMNSGGIGLALNF